MAEVLDQTAIPPEQQLIETDYVAKNNPALEVMSAAVIQFAKQFGGEPHTLASLQRIAENPQPAHAPAACRWYAHIPDGALRSNEWDTSSGKPVSERMSAEAPIGKLDGDILAALVGEAVMRAGGPLAPPEQYYHFPAAIQSALLARLPLPLGSNRPPEQQIVFPTATGFERTVSGQEALELYANQPRTTIYEDIARRDRGWQWQAIQYLMRLFEHEVVFSFFDSSVGDAGIGPHSDTWHTTAVQFYGEKAWWLGADVYAGKSEPTVILRAGDILTVPYNYPHDVKPLNSRSIHLAIDTRLDKPILTI